MTPPSGKIVVFHPSVAPFVQQVARALFEVNLLERFYTTLRDSPTSWLQGTACRLARMGGRDLRSQLKRRAVTEIPAELTESFPVGEILRLASGALDRSGRLTDSVWEWSEEAFARKVGRHLHKSLRGVYGFEHSSLAAFKVATEMGLKIFYDMPAPEPRFVQQLLEREIEKFPELLTSYHRHTAAREEERIAHRHAEWHAADQVVAASAFTKQSFASAGLDLSKVHVIPYGAPAPASREQALARAREENAPLTLVWAGTFSIRKGAHYLVEAWRTGKWGAQVRLEVYGTVSLPERILKPALDGVTFHGPVSRPDLLSAFQRADALIFPTLCDGFGMVITESWSQGLPVITTDRAGAADLLKENENGLLVPPASADALREMISALIPQRARLRAMREPSLATAARWQWADYRTALGKLLQSHLPDS